MFRIEIILVDPKARVLTELEGKPLFVNNASPGPPAQGFQAKHGAAYVCPNLKGGKFHKYMHVWASWLLGCHEP